MMPEISWFYGSPLLFGVLVTVVAALTATVITSSVRSHRHPNGGKR
jgi:hypothetical protein